MERAKYFYDRACKLAPDLSPARFGLAQTQIWDGNHDIAEGELRLVVKKSPAATDAHAALGLLMVKSGKDKKAGFQHLRKAIDLDPLNPDLILLEAYALQLEETNYTLSLDRYRKATKLMEKQGTPISWCIYTNMGVLCYETKKFEDAASCYEKAFKALDKEANYAANEAKIDGDDDLIRHKENLMFWKYQDTGITAEFSSSDEAGMSWVLEKELDAIKVGDHVLIGADFKSDVSNVDGKTIKLTHKFVPVSTNSEDIDEVNGEIETKQKLFIKRGNKRLSNPSAISIAFNFARLHEASGHILAAVELHKAIVKRHPSYVNSYLRLACISRDCGSLVDCSEWLKCACAVASGNPEVLILVGNLHLSLCDWQPAQRVFTQLLDQKIPKVDAYSMLCLGNIYFDNLKTPRRYAKHLGYAADFYRRILNKDNANAYAANGIGTVLAEKGDLPRSKEIFNRVREISGDTIPDALLNLGHIYLALSKHNEALQMYQSYMERTNIAGAQITTKNKDDDDATVLVYIAFAYYDWAKQAEVFNSPKSAPADDRYKMCIGYIEKAIKKSKKENIIFRYNLCMAKLSAANCVLQKASRGIARTAKEVKEALGGLHESLPKVQLMIQWKKEKKKVVISTTAMQNFVHNCRNNIEIAQNTLNDELNKEAEAKERREMQRLEAQTQLKEEELKELERKEQEVREQEERDTKARLKMEKVNDLVQGWELETKMQGEEGKKKKTKSNAEVKPEADDQPLFDEDSDEEENVNNGNEAASVTENPVAKDGQPENNGTQQPTDKDLFGDDDDSDDEVFGEDNKDGVAPPATKVTKEDLFGDSDSDEELKPVAKRANDEVEGNNDENVQKKRRIDDDDS
jgi:RNA polymerase-associated protein CTR9